jgi:hypothetical protein
VSDQYQVVQLANGAFSLRSERYGETFHPVVGPVAEAQALYVDQLALVERVRKAPGEFVVWDVGLGAAANPFWPAAVGGRAVEFVGMVALTIPFAPATARSLFSPSGISASDKMMSV